MISIEGVKCVMKYFVGSGGLVEESVMMKCCGVVKKKLKKC